MLHVANCVANAARIESGDTYRFYAEGVTPAVARLYQAINGERVAVAASLGASVPTLEDWFDPRRLKDDYVPTGWKGYEVKMRPVKGHDFGLKLSADDKRALIDFLKTL